MYFERIKISWLFSNFQQVIFLFLLALNRFFIVFLLKFSKKMTITLLAVGKTDASLLQNLIAEYQKRLSFYTKFTIEIIPDIKNAKNLSISEIKEREGELILKKTENHHIILLDERGNEFTSIAFSEFLQKKLNSGIKQLTFVIGGAYGFSDKVYARANGKCSLSKMTFSHQMVRLFFIEQLYRAFTILNNEPYHHQ